MTLALFLFAVLLAFGIARYNESNKLFWILTVSFMLGIAGTKVLYDTFTEKERSEQSLDQAYPTQGLVGTEDTCLCFFNNVYIPTFKKETSKLVSQVITPDYIERLLTSSDVSGVTQGIYLHVLPNPPNKVGIVNDS